MTTDLTQIHLKAQDQKKKRQLQFIKSNVKNDLKKNRTAAQWSNFVDDLVSNLDDVGTVEEYKYVDDQTQNFNDIKLTYYFGKNKYCFKVRPTPFAKGHFKFAYEAVFKSQQIVNHSTAPKFNSKCYVIKVKKNKKNFNRSDWDQDLNELQKLAIYVKMWNKLGITDKQYRASKGYVLKIKNGNNIFQTNEYVLIEKIMTDFQKWNWPCFAEKGAKSLSIQAFGHWTYHQSNGKELVNDAQGMRTDNEYVITDPYYLNSKDHKVMINSWFNDHKCNKFCKSHWKTPPNVSVTPLVDNDYGYNSKFNVAKPTNFATI